MALLGRTASFSWAASMYVHVWGGVDRWKNEQRKRSDKPERIKYDKD